MGLALLWLEQSLEEAPSPGIVWSNCYMLGWAGHLSPAKPPSPGEAWAACLAQTAEHGPDRISCSGYPVPHTRALCHKSARCIFPLAGKRYGGDSKCCNLKAQQTGSQAFLWHCLVPTTPASRVVSLHSTPGLLMSPRGRLEIPQPAQGLARPAPCLQQDRKPCPYLALERWAWLGVPSPCSVCSCLLEPYGHSLSSLTLSFAFSPPPCPHHAVLPSFVPDELPAPCLALPKAGTALLWVSPAAGTVCGVQ